MQEVARPPAQFTRRWVMPKARSSATVNITGSRLSWRMRKGVDRAPHTSGDSGL